MPTSAATGVSTNADTAVAVSEAFRQASASLAGRKPALGIVFASPKHDLQAALCAAQKVGGGAPFVGSTTAGEITERGLVHGGVALMLLASDELLLDVSLAKGVKGDTARAAAQLSRGFAEATQAANAKGLQDKS